MTLSLFNFSLGLGTFVSQETLYRSESCKGKLRRTAPCALQRWPLKLVQHVADATCISLSPAGPPSSCPLHITYLLNLSFMIGIPNRCCILELRENQCSLCNFLSFCLGIRSKLPDYIIILRRREPIVLVALFEIYEIC